MAPGVAARRLGSLWRARALPALLAAGRCSSVSTLPRARPLSAAPRDLIFLRGLKFYGFHGFFQAENELGQRFEVDAELVPERGLAEAAATDDLRKTVDYVRSYKAIKEVVEGRPRKLLETVAEDVARALLDQQALERVTVRIRKPSVAIQGQLDHVGVEITRVRAAK